MLKLPLKRPTIPPMVDPVPMLETPLVAALVGVSPRRLPEASPLHLMLPKLALVDCAILPGVDPIAMKKSSSVFSLEPIALGEKLDPVSFLEAIGELTLVYAFLPNEFAPSIEEVILPVTPILIPIAPDDHTVAAFLVFEELALVEVGSRYDFHSFSLQLTRYISTPYPQLLIPKETAVVPSNFGSFVQIKENSLFVATQVHRHVMIGLYSHPFECLDSQLSQLFWAVICTRGPGKSRNSPLHIFEFIIRLSEANLFAVGSEGDPY